MQKDPCYDNCTDDQLIELSRGGDTAATDFLMEKYKSLVRSKARAFRLPDFGDSDDLIQEGMLGLFKALRDYDAGKEASFATFAAICISRQLCTAVEGAGRKKHQVLNTAVSYDAELSAGESGASSAEGWGQNGKTTFLELLASEETDPETCYISEESGRLLRENIQEALSPLEREVLDLYLADLDYIQIAEILGKDPKSTDNALQRIKGKVRKIIKTI